MSDNFFAQGDDDNEEFRDIPDEAQLDENGRTRQAPPSNVRSARSAAPVQQQVVQAPVQYEEPEYEQEEATEEDFSTVLSDARMRMEQGRLYEMIMDHDLFAGSNADEKAIKHVQKQIRNFAKEQMEIMLGMRQEAPKAQALSAADFPFNDLEVHVLKAMASTFSKGATAAPEVQSFSGAPTPAPAKVGLNPIGVKKQAAPAPKPVAKPAQKPLAQKPAAPVKRQRNEAEIEQILAEEGISREEYNRQYDPNYQPLTKPIEQMSDAELKERARAMAARSPGQVKNPQAIPMPSPEQEEMLHTARAQTAAAHPQMQGLMNLILKQPKK